MNMAWLRSIRGLVPKEPFPSPANAWIMLTEAQIKTSAKDLNQTDLYKHYVNIIRGENNDIIFYHLDVSII